MTDATHEPWHKNPVIVIGGGILAFLAVQTFNDLQNRPQENTAQLTKAISALEDTTNALKLTVGNLDQDAPRIRKRLDEVEDQVLRNTRGLAEAQTIQDARNRRLERLEDIVK